MGVPAVRTAPALSGTLPLVQTILGGWEPWPTQRLQIHWDGSDTCRWYTSPVGIVAFVIMITGNSGWTYVGAFLLLAWAVLEVVLGITLRRRLQQGKGDPGIALICH